MPNRRIPWESGALANISNLDTVLGQFSFNEVGDGAYDPKVLIVRDGRLEAFGDGDMQ